MKCLGLLLFAKKEQKTTKEWTQNELSSIINIYCFVKKKTMHACYVVVFCVEQLSGPPVHAIHDES